MRFYCELVCSPPLYVRVTTKHAILLHRYCAPLWLAETLPLPTLGRWIEVISWSHEQCYQTKQPMLFPFLYDIFRSCWGSRVHNSNTYTTIGTIQRFCQWYCIQNDPAPWRVGGQFDRKRGGISLNLKFDSNHWTIEDSCRYLSYYWEVLEAQT